MSLELKPQDLCLSSVQGLKLYYLRQDHAIGIHTCADSRYEPFETDLLLDHLIPGDVAVDIGANIGVYTLQMAKQVEQAGKVYAFEPEPTNFELLTKNVKENNLTNVICSELALSNKTNLTTLFISEENFGDHQLYQDNSGRRRVSVMTDTLDNLFKDTYNQAPIKLIKIDTQGCEPFIILGAKEIISQQRPTLFLEYWPYGYQRTGADAHAMISFLLQIYKRMYFIDEANKSLFAATQEFIDDYCQAMDGYLYCNLAFFGRGPYSSRL